jgi:serine/threonine-protein kinase HipA
MRKMTVYSDEILAGWLEELEDATYQFSYRLEYSGAPVSLTMPITTTTYTYSNFPPFFEGLLPEGIQLEALLRSRKLDKNDLWGQLSAVGADLVGNVTVADVEIPS